MHRKKHSIVECRWEKGNREIKQETSSKNEHNENLMQNIKIWMQTEHISKENKDG